MTIPVAFHYRGRITGKQTLLPRYFHSWDMERERVGEKEDSSSLL